MAAHEPEKGSLHQLKQERVTKHVNPTRLKSAITSFLENLSNELKPAPSEHLRSARLNFLTLLDAEIARQAREAKKQNNQNASSSSYSAEIHEDESSCCRNEPTSRFISRSEVLLNATLPSGHLKPSLSPCLSATPSSSSSSTTTAATATATATNNSESDITRTTLPQTPLPLPQTPSPSPPPTPTQARSVRAYKLSTGKKQVRQQLLRSKNFRGLQANNVAAEMLRARQVLRLRNLLNCDQASRGTVENARDRTVRRVRRRVRETLKLLGVTI